MEGRAARPTNPRRVPQHALMRTRSRVPRVPNREILLVCELVHRPSFARREIIDVARNASAVGGFGQLKGVLQTGWRGNSLGFPHREAAKTSTVPAPRRWYKA